MQEMTEVTASFVRKLTKQYKNGWGVIVVRAKGAENLPKEIASKKGRYEFSAVGYNLLTAEGSTCKYSGVWEETKFGTQFKVASYEEITPTDFEGMVKYLSSSRFKGIGKKLAMNICLKFGNDVFQVIAETPEKLLEVSGMTEKKMKVIKDSFQNSKAFRELASLLLPLGFELATVSRISAEIKEDPTDDIRKNPYILLRKKLCGFKMADRIARKLGIQLTSGDRISGAIIYCLNEDSARFGNMYTDLNVLYQNAMELLNDGFESPIVDQNTFVSVLNKMIGDRDISFRQGKVFSYSNELIEHEIAENLLRIQHEPIPEKEQQTFENSLVDVLQGLQFSPSKGQIAAVKTALKNRVSVITGGPGTGKTTILRVVIQAYSKAKEALGEEAIVTGLAPTGKARSRMAQATGVPCYTIHSRCGIYGEEGRLAVEDLPESSLVIIDEMSMVDSFTMNRMLAKIPSDAHLVMVGDVDQLPSVGAGAVLHEILASNVIPAYRLTEIFRQADGSTIVENSVRIKEGKTDLMFNDDFCFLPVEREEEALELLKREYLKDCKKYGIDNVAVLCPLRRKRLVAVDNLNSELQQMVNPASAGTIEITFNNKTFRTNDRVIQTKNTEAVANGDIGVIQRIYYDDPDDKSSFVVIIKFENDLLVEYTKDDMLNVDLAYCLTIHKSQGSEYDCVIIPILASQYCGLFKRNILYTGVTRSKTHLELLGNVEAIKRCILTKDEGTRNTTLAARLIAQAELEKGKESD